MSSRRDPLKGKIIAKTMAQFGCTYEQAEVVYVELIEKRVIRPVVQVMAGIVARQAYREVMGVDLPECN